MAEAIKNMPMGKTPNSGPKKLGKRSNTDAIPTVPLGTRERIHLKAEAQRAKKARRAGQETLKKEIEGPEIGTRKRIRQRRAKQEAGKIYATREAKKTMAEKTPIGTEAEAKVAEFKQIVAENLTPILGAINDSRIVNKLKNAFEAEAFITKNLHRTAKEFSTFLRQQINLKLAEEKKKQPAPQIVGIPPKQPKKSIDVQGKFVKKKSWWDRLTGK